MPLHRHGRIRRPFCTSAIAAALWVSGSRAYEADRRIGSPDCWLAKIGIDMTRYFRARVLFISLIIPGLQAPVLSAQQSRAPIAPIPEQILAAKKVFVANAGGEDPSSDDPLFSGGPDRAYNQFYAAMKTWGRYE